MKDRGVVPVALVATVGISVQNTGAALGAGWGMIHGAGLGVVVALVPLALGLALLWAGYLFLSRRRIRGATAIFTTYALGLLLLNEMLLPMTPLRAWKGQRNVNAIDVHDIRDEVFLSARGNPIGIRLTFEVRFPEAVVANVSASVFGPIAGLAPRPLQLARGHQRSIEPSPASEGGYHVFRKDTVYRFTQTTLPNFLSYDERTQQPCLMAVETTVSEAQFLDMLSSTAPQKYQTDILAGSDFDPTNQLLQMYVTSRDYDVKSMYETIVREGNRRCGS
jgi:hypothetical protein